jgi:hypothetical protein
LGKDGDLPGRRECSSRRHSNRHNPCALRYELNKFLVALSMTHGSWIPVGSKRSEDLGFPDPLQCRKIECGIRCRGTDHVQQSHEVRHRRCPSHVCTKGPRCSFRIVAENSKQSAHRVARNNLRHNMCRYTNDIVIWLLVQWHKDLEALSERNADDLEKPADCACQIRLAYV